jgi:hypothetical protein
MQAARLPPQVIVMLLWRERRDDPSLSEAQVSSAFADAAFAAASADEPTPAMVFAKLPSAVSSTHPVQSPSGASENIFAPHFRQSLITLAIRHEFETHSLPRSLAATRRGFTFYVAHPLSSIQEFTPIGGVRCLNFVVIGVYPCRFMVS